MRLRILKGKEICKVKAVLKWLEILVINSRKNR